MKKVLMGFLALLFICYLVFFNGKMSRKLEFDENVIHLLARPEVFQADFLQKYETEKEIKIQVQYFSSQDELLTIMKKNKGKDIDLIAASSDEIQLLGNLIREMDGFAIPKACVKEVLVKDFIQFLSNTKEENDVFGAK